MKNIGIGDYVAYSFGHRSRHLRKVINRNDKFLVLDGGFLVDRFNLQPYCANAMCWELDDFDRNELKLMRAQVRLFECSRLLRYNLSHETFCMGSDLIDDASNLCDKIESFLDKVLEGK